MPEAEAALHAAEAIALERSAALSVYCVVEPTPRTESMIAAGTGGEWPSQAANGRARRLLYAVSDNAPQGLKPQTVLLHGAPAEKIARRVDGVVDLLFVGSRGYGPLRRALLGSVSGALARDAGCPVIITPRTAVGPRRAPEAAAAARMTASAAEVEDARHGSICSTSLSEPDRTPPRLSADFPRFGVGRARVASGSMVSTATYQTRGALSRGHLDRSVLYTLTTGEWE